MRTLTGLLLALALTGSAMAAEPVTPPLSDICAALAAADGDVQTMTDEQWKTANAAANDGRPWTWRQFQIWRIDPLTKGPWGECPTPKNQIWYLAFTPDGRFALLDTRPSADRSPDGDSLMAYKGEAGWRLVYRATRMVVQ